MKLHFIVWYIFFCVLDVTTTVLLLAMDPTIEANPIGAALYAGLGPLGLILGKLVSIGVVSYCVYHMHQSHLRLLAVVTTPLMGFVVLNNTFNLYLGLGVI